MWDTIVVGSGIGGLTAAAALARCGQRVLVLEQHSRAGGLTQTFKRHGWSFATGVHYVSGVGPDSGAAGQFGRILHWLTDGAMQFADCGNPYDVVRLPGFTFAIDHPQAAYRRALHSCFPAQHGAIEDWFAEMDAATKAARAMFIARGLPEWLAWCLRLWSGDEVRHYSQRTVSQALTPIADPLLRAVLGARWGNYGAAPDSAPLLEHAMVCGAYDGGAYYPVGGPGRFAQTMRPVIERSGGELRLGADVKKIRVTDGRATAVVFDQGGVQHVEDAAHIISGMGVANTVACLDATVAPAWQDMVHALRPGLSYIALYLGFEGDIATAGASAANAWIYDSVDIGGVWQSPADHDAPALFVSFPSLKDPAHVGPHTGEVLALCDARAFEPWLNRPDSTRPPEYLALKAKAEERLLAQFRHHFPALAPMLRFHELSTPLTQQHFVRAPGGAMYGIEMSAQRLVSKSLDLRTPIAGLLLAGQDVSGAGIQAACMSGLLASAAIDPSLLQRLIG